MVKADKFVWAHIPKTGGDSTVALFNQLSGKALTFVEDNRKHDSFRRQGVSGLARIANIRRLPLFVRSWASHYGQHAKWGQRNIDQPFTREQLLAGMLWWLEPYTTRWRLVHLDTVIADYYEIESIDEWLRLENLFEDFQRIVGSYVDVSAVRASHWENRGAYKRTRWFSREEVARLYETCPRWAALEKRIYGTLDADAEEHENEAPSMVQRVRSLRLRIENRLRRGIA